jgi:hypothetical protein
MQRKKYVNFSFLLCGLLLYFNLNCCALLVVTEGTHVFDMKKSVHLCSKIVSDLVDVVRLRFYILLRDNFSCLVPL